MLMALIYLLLGEERFQILLSEPARGNSWKRPDLLCLFNYFSGSFSLVLFSLDRDPSQSLIPENASYYLKPS